MPVFERVREVACSAQDLFAFHAVPAALARLTPPFEKAVVIVPLLALKNGACAELQVSIGPVSTRWSAVHRDVKEGSDGGVAGFVDTEATRPAQVVDVDQAFFPTITIDDVAAAFLRVLVDERAVGVFNAVGAHNVCNRDYARMLGRVLGRPAVLRVPAFA